MDDPIHSFVEGAENGSSNDFPAVGLKKFKRSLKNITYDISDLYNYIDNLCDLCCLVFQPQSNSYVPHNKEWIKARIFEHLKKQAIL